MRRSSRIAVVGTLVLACAASARAGVVLDDAVSMIDLWCASVDEAVDDETTPGSYDCERAVTTATATGTTRANASTSFGDLLATVVHTECVECPAPLAPSTLASSRISFSLAVAQRAAPPQPVATVPVRLVTEGDVGVSNLGFLAGGGTYLNSTLPTVPFTVGDVFAHSMRTNPPSGHVLSDDYAITETVELIPGHVYFGNVYAGCNQFSSAAGSWACSGHASVSFALDQAAFDASMGGESFELSQFFAIERSPNLVPEPSAALGGAASLAALARARRAKRFGRRVAAAMLPA